MSKNRTSPEISTLIGYKSKKSVYIPDNAKHILVAGTTGAGKTVVLSNFIKSAAEKKLPALVLDGKGDTGEGSLYDICKRLKGNKKLYVINLSQPHKSDKYNPFQGASATVVKDMLINMTDWSEEHYKLNTERYLQRLVKLMLMANMQLTFIKIIRHLPVKKFQELSASLLEGGKIDKIDHLENIEISKTSGKIAETAVARFSTIAESEVGSIFSNEGINIYQALKENSLILFILNPLLYPEISKLMGRLILIDSKQAVSNLYSHTIERGFFLLDELNVYASPVLIDLINKSRSANITCIPSVQSLSDLDIIDEAFKEQVIENCNNYIVLRQNSSTNAEQWANILGTKATMEVTYQLQQEGLQTSQTGLGSARRVREFLYHPDDIKKLRQGQAIFLSRDNQFHAKIDIVKPF